MCRICVNLSTCVKCYTETINVKRVVNDGGVCRAECQDTDFFAKESDGQNICVECPNDCMDGCMDENTCLGCYDGLEPLLNGPFGCTRECPSGYYETGFNCEACVDIKCS